MSSRRRENLAGARSSVSPLLVVITTVKGRTQLGGEPEYDDEYLSAIELSSPAPRSRALPGTLEESAFES